MSNTDGKVKIYKNKDRDKPVVHAPYVPQYQVIGVDPQEHNGAAVSGDVKIARPSPLPNDNPRAKRSPVRRPYAETTASPIGMGPVPNVGNNMEHTWSSIDGVIVDDIGVDENSEMIDNNDFVTDQALGYQNGVTARDISQHHPQGNVTIEEVPVENNNSYEEVMPPPAIHEDIDSLLSILSDLESDSYLLIVSGVPVCSGPKEEIEDQARALVFGEHELCDGNPVEIDDIVIVKRISIKVGLFLD